MKRKWLIIDAPYIAHRNFHALKHLPASDIGTEVVFGFMHDIIRFQERHETKHIAFAFDRGESYRCDIYPGYKCSRAQRYSEEDSEDQQKRKRLHKQMRALRREHLEAIGYRNIFSQQYMEADDIIASLCLNSLGDDTAVIITADHDFYQLLGPQVSVWHPKLQHLVTAQGFRKTYGIEPEQWVNVKAIAGCRSDDIIGIKGIGEATAVKFVRGILDHKYKSYTKILDGLRVWKKNMKIVKLPFEGVDRFELCRDEVTRASWKRFAKDMGMRSLLSIEPYGVRK
jgi:DNA polymerase-1